MSEKSGLGGPFSRAAFTVTHLHPPRGQLPPSGLEGLPPRVGEHPGIGRKAPGRLLAGGGPRAAGPLALGGDPTGTGLPSLSPSLPAGDPGLGTLSSPRGPSLPPSAGGLGRSEANGPAPSPHTSRASPGRARWVARTSAQGPGVPSHPSAAAFPSPPRRSRAPHSPGSLPALCEPWRPAAHYPPIRRSLSRPHRRSLWTGGQRSALRASVSDRPLELALRPSRPEELLGGTSLRTAGRGGVGDPKTEPPHPGALGAPVAPGPRDRLGAARSGLSGVASGERGGGLPRGDPGEPHRRLPVVPETGLPSHARAPGKDRGVVDRRDGETEAQAPGPPRGD